MSPTNEFISYPIVEDDVVVVAGDNTRYFAGAPRCRIYSRIAGVAARYV
jgi:hypothetical protein